MAEKVRRMGYYYIEVKDQPGEALRALNRLRAGGVNLLNFTAFPIAEGRSQIDFVPEDESAFVKASGAAGLALSPRKECFFLRGADRVGAVADVLQKLADAGINAHAANASCGQGGGYGMILWVRATDVEAAGRALGV